MRVTSDFFVSALVRRVERAGGFAAVIRRGAGEAGAVFVVERQRGGDVALYRPAPQALYDAGRPMERQFVCATDLSGQDAIDAALAREMRFDSDIWIVEIEPSGDASTYLAVMTP